MWYWMTLHGADSSRMKSYFYWVSIDSCAYVNGIKFNHILGTFWLRKCDFPLSYTGGNVMEWSLWSRSAGLCNQAFCLKWLKVEVILKSSTGSLAVEENLSIILTSFLIRDTEANSAVIKFLLWISPLDMMPIFFLSLGLCKNIMMNINHKT